MPALATEASISGRNAVTARCSSPALSPRSPAGRNLCWATNSVGTGGSHRWLTSNAGTGDWKEYVYKVVCGTADFSSTHFFYVDGTQGDFRYACHLVCGLCHVFDLTSTEKYTTTIDANGIYTGTVRANQIIVDSALTVGGSSYNGSISVKDANNSVKVTLDRNGITAVSARSAAGFSEQAP